MAIRIFYLFLLLFFVQMNIYSCDFCSLILGQNPSYKGRPFISLSLLHQNSSTGPQTGDVTHAASRPAGGANSPLLPQHGIQTSAELKEQLSYLIADGQVFLSDEFFLNYSVPFSIRKYEFENTLLVRGLGDISVTGNYAFEVEDDAGNISSVYIIGGGLKLPTGHYTLNDDAGKRMDPRLQPGTGTTDFLAAGAAYIYFDGVVLSFDAVAKINTTNTFGHHQGNAVNASLSASHSFFRDISYGFSLLGSGGLRFENYGRETVSGRLDQLSGSSSLYAVWGLHPSWEAIQWNLGIQIPLIQNRHSVNPDETPRYSTSVRLYL